jgi:uncharacterized protein
MQRLLIELVSIPPEGTTRRFRSTGAELGIDDPEFAVVQPIDIECQLVKVNREVIVHGSLRSAVRLTCSRCAEDFVSPLTLALDAVFLPEFDLSSERAKELEDDVTDVYSYAEQAVDLAEMVRDKLFLSMPLQPYCRVDCKGLCAACGVNRNVVSCQCAEAKLGSPFELLKAWRLS